MTSKINSALNMRFITRPVNAAQALVSLLIKHKRCHGGKVKKKMNVLESQADRWRENFLPCNLLRLSSRFICVEFFAFC